MFDSSVQFTCVATDAGGELLVAGSRGSCFSAFVWSVRTAKLLEELAGHEAPVVTVAFHPHPDKQGLLATGSWDKKVKVRCSAVLTRAFPKASPSKPLCQKFLVHQR